MDNILFEFLSQNETPEMFDLYRRAGGIIEHFGMEDNYSPLIDMIHTKDVYESNTVNDLTFALFNQILDNIINDFNITLTENALMKDKCEIIESILMLEDTSENQKALDLIDAYEEDPEDCLSELFTIVTAYPSDYYINLIKRVSPGLINRLKEVMKANKTNDEMEETKEEDNLEKTIISNISSILKRYNTNPPITNNEGCAIVNSRPLVFFASSSPVLLNFEELMGLLDGEVMDDDLKLTAFNLYVIASASKDGCLDPLRFLPTVLDKFIPSIDESKTVLEEIRKIKSNLITVGVRNEKA